MCGYSFNEELAVVHEEGTNMAAMMHCGWGEQQKPQYTATDARPFAALKRMAWRAKRINYLLHATQLNPEVKNYSFY